MMDLRKLIAAFLLLSMLVFAVAGGADTITQNDSGTSREIEVTLDMSNVSAEYTIVIPAEVNIDPQTGKGNASVSLQAGFILGNISTLGVYLGDGFYTSSSNGTYMLLTNAANSNSVQCDVYREDSLNTPLDKNVALIQVESGTDNDVGRTCGLVFKVERMPSSGIFKGKFTFKVQLN